jgi:hypothetical protein
MKTFVSVVAAILVSVAILSAVLKYQWEREAEESLAAYRARKLAEEREQSARWDRAEACNAHLKSIGDETKYAVQLSQDEYDHCMALSPKRGE